MVASLHFTSADENDFIADGNGFNYKRFVFSSAVAAASDQLVLAENVEGGNEDGDVRDERRRVCDIVAGNGEQEQVTLTMTSQIVVIYAQFAHLSSCHQATSGATYWTIHAFFQCDATSCFEESALA